MPEPRDLELRKAAFDRVRYLQRRFDDLIPLTALRQGFVHAGQRVSFGSFYSGIFRPREMVGPAALAMVTTPPKGSRPAPYEDEFDAGTGRFTYRFRDPTSPTSAATRQAAADNRALLAAHEQGVPLIYFRGIAPAQYSAVAPVFITAVNEERRLVEFEAALPVADTTAPIHEVFDVSVNSSLKGRTPPPRPRPPPPAWSLGTAGPAPRLMARSPATRPNPTTLQLTGS